MPSKLRKAIGAVKDQTSISLAKVSNNASNLDIAVLKATTHDEIPMDERYVTEILQLVTSNKVYAAACAQAIAKRIGKTRNWIVALKSLMLVLQIFQDGDPYFPCEVLHAMKRGSKILNLSSFRDDSNSSPWDYTAFVRTCSLYLDERLDCFLTGKLQRRFTFRERESNHRRSRRRGNEPVRDMKPTMLLDRISYWQRLLDRAIATRPTGAAKTNRLVQISLYAIVRESFDLYRDISDGLALLLDSFFHLQYQSCVNAFQTCVKASKQFGELCSFYTFCKSIGVGRTSEYPSVQKISDELVETLQEFLKDQASFPTNGRSQSSHLLLLPAPSTSMDPSSSSEQCCESNEQSEISELEEATGTSPSISADQEPDSDHQEQEQKTYWEHVLAETTTQSTQVISTVANSFNPSFPDGLNNPFLQDTTEITATATAATTNAQTVLPSADILFLTAPTFQATPTFCAQNSSEMTMALQIENDPFAMVDEQMFNGSVNQENVLHEQQLWLQHQNKIIAKHMS